MTYESTKMFAIRKMKTQFTNKNTHVIYAQTYYRSMRCCRRLFDWGAENEGRRPEVLQLFSIHSLRLKQM